MALHPLPPGQLARAPTLFATFMGDQGEQRKTVGQLLSIYRRRRETLRPSEDVADDLRVDRFMSDMAGDRWASDVVIRIGVFDDTVLVIDGIHRAIAYLACIEQGLGAEQLPALCVDR